MRLLGGYSPPSASPSEISQWSPAEPSSTGCWLEGKAYPNPNFLQAWSPSTMVLMELLRRAAWHADAGRYETLIIR